MKFFSFKQKPLAVTALGLTSILAATGCNAQTAAPNPIQTNASAQVTPAARPNVLLILADDLGWSDIGCFGSEIKTPNIDALASTGMAFTQVYNSARCCPTRASLMTGLTPHQAGFPHMDGVISQNAVTLPEVLNDAG
ncbi:hypothetical protein EON80_27205, partial [bacterium]